MPFLCFHTAPTSRLYLYGLVVAAVFAAGEVRFPGSYTLSSKGERLDTGDVISTGTMPSCCGLELERWIKPGQTVELEIDRIGTLTNRLSASASPTTAVPA